MDEMLMYLVIAIIAGGAIPIIAFMLLKIVKKKTK